MTRLVWLITALIELGVPPERVHTERFDMV